MQTNKPVCAPGLSRKMSGRDEATLLIKRFGREVLSDIVRGISIAPSQRIRGVNAKNCREALLAALYLLRCFSTNKPTIAAFARNISQVVEIRYARRVTADRLAYRSYKTPQALEQDLRRGLLKHDEKSYIGTRSRLVRLRTVVSEN
jgi:hypothetical protein